MQSCPPCHRHLTHIHSALSISVHVGPTSICVPLLEAVSGFWKLLCPPCSRPEVLGLEALGSILQQG